MSEKDPIEQIHELEKVVAKSAQETNGRLIRLEERDKSQWEVLAEIKDGIKRIETKIDDKPPCQDHARRIDTLEDGFKTVVVKDHEDRLKTGEGWRERWSGRMIILGPAAFILATAIATWIATAMAAAPAG